MFKQARAVLVFALFGLNVLCPMAIVLADDSAAETVTEVPIEVIESETRIEFSPLHVQISAWKSPFAV